MGDKRQDSLTTSKARSESGNLMRFRWNEVSEDVRSPSIPIAIAARTDGPLPDDSASSNAIRQVTQTHFRPYGRVETRQGGTQTTPGSVYAAPRRGVALAAAIQYTQTRLDAEAINFLIGSALNDRGMTVAEIMQNHETGGLLAVAQVLVRYDPRNGWGFAGPGERPIRNSGMQTRRLAGVAIDYTVYALPEHAISVWRNRIAFEEAPRDNEYCEYRFFWGTWVPD